MRAICAFLLLLIASAAAATAADAPAHPFLADKAKALMSADGKAADQHRLGKKYVLVYFSAHWCPPCRAFTPQLVEWYGAHGGGDAFEVLFVSCDRTGEDMLHYMADAKMPWVGLRWGASTTQAIKAKYAGPGVPCLVLLDGDDKVLSDSYVAGAYVGPQKVLEDLGTLLTAK